MKISYLPALSLLLTFMAGGQALSASAAAQAMGRNFDGVSKHLRVLLDAGVVECRAGEDRRFGMYAVPEQVRRADGVLDYGFCVIRAA